MGDIKKLDVAGFLSRVESISPGYIDSLWDRYAEADQFLEKHMNSISHQFAWQISNQFHELLQPAYMGTQATMQNFFALFLFLLFY